MSVIDTWLYKCGDSFFAVYSSANVPSLKYKLTLCQCIIDIYFHGVATFCKIITFIIKFYMFCVVENFSSGQTGLYRRIDGLTGHELGIRRNTIGLLPRPMWF